MRATGLAAALAGLAGAALAQEGRMHVPCLAVHPQPTDYVAAFEAAGWTAMEAGPAREQAVGGLALATMLAAMLPTRPRTEAELAELLALGEASREARRFDQALVFTRGDAAAALHFDERADGRVLACTFAAPDLAELDGLAMEPMQMGDRPVAIEVAVSAEPVPPGAESIRVNAWRLVSDVAPPAPVPGSEALSVMIVRTEPRRLVPQLHGLLQAFGPEEMSEALRAPQEGGK